VSTRHTSSSEADNDGIAPTARGAVHRIRRVEAPPPFDEDDAAAHALAIAHWRDAIAQADVILFATPEYNSSIPGQPGQLKNAVDWASRPVNDAVLRNKPVAVIGASASACGALWAQAELRKVLAAAGARVIDRELPVASAHDAFEDDATLKDRDLVLELDWILVVPA
jgi:chromate reductase